ncbi:MAG: M48 family metallopeptidase, partial [Elusimicrobiota bacterium]
MVKKLSAACLSVCLLLAGLPAGAAAPKAVTVKRSGTAASSLPSFNPALIRIQLSLLQGPDLAANLQRIKAVATVAPAAPEAAAARQVLAWVADPALLAKAAPQITAKIDAPALAAIQGAAAALRQDPNPTVLASLSTFVSDLADKEDAERKIDAAYDAIRKPADSALLQLRTLKGPTRVQVKNPARSDPDPASPARPGIKPTHALFQLRHAVQKDARTIMTEQLGGDIGNGPIHRDVQRVLRRLARKAGIPGEAVQIFIGNSFLPNAFTTITQSESEYIASNADIGKTFRVFNVFISLGLLRAVENEDQLAFVLAHELTHNLKGHLKDATGLNQVTLGHFHELEADAEGLKLAAAAGYDPRLASDSLYALDREYARLEKEYTLIARNRSEAAQTLNRLRDIHPHSDIRRANMTAH